MIRKEKYFYGFSMAFFDKNLKDIDHIKHGALACYWIDWYLLTLIIISWKMNSQTGLWNSMTYLDSYYHYTFLFQQHFQDDCNPSLRVWGLGWSRCVSVIVFHIHNSLYTSTTRSKQNNRHPLKTTGKREKNYLLSRVDVKNANVDNSPSD